MVSKASSLPSFGLVMPPLMQGNKINNSSYEARESQEKASDMFTCFESRQKKKGYFNTEAGKIKGIPGIFSGPCLQRRCIHAQMTCSSADGMTAC